jgi:CYTH domain-containing protein
MNRRDWAMATYEIERKFLVLEVPVNIESYPFEEISQGYLSVSDDGIEVRLRKMGQAYFLTVKSGKGIKRQEIETELNKEQFDILWPKTEGKRVEKRRVNISTENVIIELDIYHGNLESLKTAEVEFKAQEEADAFKPLSWFGKEITLDERYKNKNLALNGLPLESG